MLDALEAEDDSPIENEAALAAWAEREARQLGLIRQNSKGK